MSPLGELKVDPEAASNINGDYPKVLPRFLEEA